MSEPQHSLMPALRTALPAGALALLWAAMLSFGTGGLDAEVLRAIYAGGHPVLVEVARGFTFLGTWQFGIPAVAVGIALLLWLKRRRDAVAVFLVVALGRLLVEVQKHAVHRLRPAIEPHLVRVASASFPSGHAANSTIVCLTFAIVFFGRTRWRLVAVVLAVLLFLCIGLSRLMLGVHWPSDVTAGWAFGLSWVIVMLPLAQRLANRGAVR